jgi:hypothetical protein
MPGTVAWIIVECALDRGDELPFESCPRNDVAFWPRVAGELIVAKRVIHNCGDSLIEMIACRGNKPIDLAAVGNVGLKRDGARSEAFYECLGCLGTATVVDNDAGAFSNENRRDCRAESAAGPSHENDLICDLHLDAPFVGWMTSKSIFCTYRGNLCLELNQARRPLDPAACEHREPREGRR